MSCCGGYCDCGPDCKCGSGGGCNMHTGISESTTTATVIVGVRPSKAYFVDAVMGFGAENDCKCGSGCSCDDCACGCKK